jgi:hypothetical protein
MSPWLGIPGSKLYPRGLRYLTNGVCNRSSEIKQVDDGSGNPV